MCFDGNTILSQLEFSNIRLKKSIICKSVYHTHHMSFMHMVHPVVPPHLKLQLHMKG